MKARIILLAMLLLPCSAWAQTTGFYHTGLADANGANVSSSGMENSAIVSIKGGGSVIMLSAASYNTSVAEVAMLFDSATLPANNAIPVAVCPLGIATSAAAPATCSFSLPYYGMYLEKGLTVACSTTGKKLTVDATSGGNCFFGVSWK